MSLRLALATGRAVGRQGNQYISADELAERTGTINYEILTNVVPRLPRR
ncbi:MAG: hypothetical protein HND48_08730 [Chloroflexi bacterium]|nr:hypothetical protein [Chloroflexota bacterium]